MVDAVLPILPETSATAKSGYMSDLVMLTQNPGGKERNENEFKELAKGSGFSDVKHVCSVSGLVVMEFYK